MVAGLVHPLVTEVKFTSLLKKLHKFIIINSEIEKLKSFFFIPSTGCWKWYSISTFFYFMKNMLNKL